MFYDPLVRVAIILKNILIEGVNMKKYIVCVYGNCTVYNLIHAN
jgi:hypothetical protein